MVVNGTFISPETNENCARLQINAEVYYGHILSSGYYAYQNCKLKVVDNSDAVRIP